MGRALWRCIEQHVHRTAPGIQRKVLPADIARATGLSAQLVSNLQNKQELPRPKTLAAVRDGLGIPYRTLLDAALVDRKWLPEPPPTMALEEKLDARVVEAREAAEAAEARATPKMRKRGTA